MRRFRAYGTSRMYNILNKWFLFALVVLMLSSATSAAPLATAVPKTQMEQLREIYKLLMSNKSYKNKKRKTSKASYSPKKGKGKVYSNRLRVTATAYTSHVAQTDSTPNIAAWGDRLRPGMKSIAVSRDLLYKYGLKHKQKVQIKGLPGEYVVLDKMNKRWRKKIDIYMGLNKRKAFKWGRRKVEILWN